MCDIVLSANKKTKTLQEGAAAVSERPQSTSAPDIPLELVGAYSTWKKKDGSGEDSNRHTYGVDAKGRKYNISRKTFKEKYESEAHSSDSPTPDNDLSPAPIDTDFVDESLEGNSRSDLIDTDSPAAAQTTDTGEPGKKSWVDFNNSGVWGPDIKNWKTPSMDWIAKNDSSELPPPAITDPGDPIVSTSGTGSERRGRGRLGVRSNDNINDPQYWPSEPWPSQPAVNETVGGSTENSTIFAINGENKNTIRTKLGRITQKLGAAALGAWFSSRGNTNGTAPTEVIAPEKEVKTDRRKRIEKAVGVAAVALAMLTASDGPQDNELHNANVADATPNSASTVIEENTPEDDVSRLYTISPTPTVAPSEIVEPAVAIVSTEVSRPTIEPTTTPVETSEEEIPLMSTETTTPTPTTTPESESTIIETPEPTQPNSTSTPTSTTEQVIESRDDTATPTTTENTAEAEPDQSNTEHASGAIENLMLSVPVESGDGITQVLAKALARAGYTNLTPEQLFGVYEELVTDPEIGPDRIFSGITLEYNQAADEYWIQGPGGVDARLTLAAAEWIHDAILEQK